MNLSNKTQIEKFYAYRSILALIASIIVFTFSLAGIIWGFLIEPSETFPEMGSIKVLEFFTSIANIVACIGCVLLIPNAITCIRKYQYVTPRWAIKFLYGGTIMLSFVFLFSINILIPMIGLDAIKGNNFLLHIITPIFCILLFCFIESDCHLTYKDLFIALIPFVIYAIVYYIMVGLIGESNGGWRDLYNFTKYVPKEVALLSMLLGAFIIAFILRLVHNFFNEKRKILMSKKIAHDYKFDTVDEVKEAVYKLGERLQLISYKNELNIPLETLFIVAEKNYLPFNKVLDIYIDGALKIVLKRKEERKLEKAKLKQRKKLKKDERTN